jgi:two-component system LytT family response regulator
MIKTIIIDDEPDSTELLHLQLTNNCPPIEVLGKYTSSVAGLKAVEKLEPDLVFLDIEMPVMNGFELLEKVSNLNFTVIFITAYDQFALKAFRFNALDYLVKPVETEDLVNAVAKAEKNIRTYPSQLSNVQKQLRGEPLTKIAVPDHHGVMFIDLAEILYAESNNNYTRLILGDGRQFTISKTLGDVQDVLEERNFLRIHRQYIVNLNKIKQFFRGEGMYLVMDNGKNIPVARNQKDKLIDKFGWL